MLPSTPDELGVYLRKIAKTPLLSRDNERATAERFCRTRHKFLTQLLANDYSLRIVLAAARRLPTTSCVSTTSSTYKGLMRPHVNFKSSSSRSLC